MATGYARIVRFEKVTVKAAGKISAAAVMFSGKSD
jgi:hypothetical protein